MALIVRWSHTAWDDVDQIVEFIAQDSPSYARCAYRFNYFPRFVRFVRFGIGFRVSAPI